MNLGRNNEEVLVYFITASKVCCQCAQVIQKLSGASVFGISFCGYLSILILFRCSWVYLWWPQKLSRLGAVGQVRITIDWYLQIAGKTIYVYTDILPENLQTSLNKRSRKGAREAKGQCFLFIKEVLLARGCHDPGRAYHLRSGCACASWLSS